MSDKAVTRTPANAGVLHYTANYAGTSAKLTIANSGRFDFSETAASVRKCIGCQAYPRIPITSSQGVVYRWLSISRRIAQTGVAGTWPICTVSLPSLRLISSIIVIGRLVPWRNSRTWLRFWSSGMPISRAKAVANASAQLSWVGNSGHVAPRVSRLGRTPRHAYVKSCCTWKSIYGYE